MKIEEFRILVKGMKAVYNAPWFLPDDDSVKIWFNLLKDLDYDSCNVSIQKWMMTHPEPPTIADVRKTTQEVSTPAIDGWDSAWEKVLKTVHRYGTYRELEALEQLDELSRECVRRLGYKSICMSENIGIERASFRDIYKQLLERKKQDALISPKVMNMIQMIQGNNNLIEGE